MNSSPVLLLQPTAPISMSMGSMNLSAIDTRTTMIASPVTPSSKLEALKGKNTTEADVSSPAGTTIRSTLPVSQSISLGTTSTGTACSPRDPSAKLATQYVTSTKLSPGANATAIVDAPSIASTSMVHPTLNASPACPPHVTHSMTHGHALHASPLMIPPHTAPTTPPNSKRATSSAPSPAPVTKSTSPKPVKSNTGRWTEGEHKLFLKGLEQFPYRAWKKIATLIKTRSVVQIRTHAQKYYQKMEKEEQRNRERESQMSAQSSRTPLSDGSAPSMPASHVSPEPKHHMMNATSSMADELMEDESDDEDSFYHKTNPSSLKRPFSGDEDLFPQSSLPKRMAKEKKCMREKTLSPKQKVVTSNSKLFGHVLCGEFGMDGLSASPNPRTTTNGPPTRNLDTIKTDRLDLLEGESSDTNMLLGFADVKPLDYPFSLESSLDQGLAGMDNDELLQLTDDESMDWFTNDDQDDNVVLDGESAKPTPVSSPLNLGRYAFAPLYTQDSLQFVDPERSVKSTTDCLTSPILTSSTDCGDFGLSADEDEDFVLDPEKFLSSYFSPGVSQSHA